MHKASYQEAKLLLAGVCSLSGYLFIGYFLERHESMPLLSAYAALFLLYLFLYRQVHSFSQLKVVLGLALVLRLVLLPSLPTLSDDFYRFIWDGRLLLQGIHPFAELPSYYMQQGHLAKDSYGYFLYTHMNSPGYFTVYPPVCQLIFTLAAWLTPENTAGSVIFMRLLIILAEAGTVFLMLTLLKKYGLPRKYVLLYALNPLVILELTGNLHFEGLMLLFLLLSLHFFHKNKLVPTALFFALAIGAKLLPLILLPLYVRRLGWRKSFRFFGVTALFTLLLFAPLINTELVQGLSAGVSLYFQKFEFNAGLYYLVREIGYAALGYNTIAVAGKVLAGCTFAAIVLFAYQEKARELRLPAAYLWVWFIYLLFATTVHPWYIIPLLAYSIFTTYRFSVLWSGLIFITYAGYSREGYHELLWFTLIEYLLILVFCLYEYFNRKTQALTK